MQLISGIVLNSEVQNYAVIMEKLATSDSRVQSLFFLTAEEHTVLVTGEP